MIQAELHTSEYRGDHTADTVIGLKSRDGETVKGFFRRVIEIWNSAKANPADYIVLRAVVDVGPKDDGLDHNI